MKRTVIPIILTLLMIPALISCHSMAAAQQLEEPTEEERLEQEYLEFFRPILRQAKKNINYEEHLYAIEAVEYTIVERPLSVRAPRYSPSDSYWYRSENSELNHKLFNEVRRLLVEYAISENLSLEELEKWVKVARGYRET